MNCLTLGLYIYLCCGISVLRSFSALNVQHSITGFVSKTAERQLVPGVKLGNYAHGLLIISVADTSKYSELCNNPERFRAAVSSNQDVRQEVSELRLHRY